MTITDRIEINPKVMLGKPVIRGTRITIELILRKLSEGASEAQLLDAYPRLVREDIRAAIAYAADTLARDRGARQPTTPEPEATMPTRGEFWESKSLNELIREQEVHPVERLDSLLGQGADLWNTDEEFEAFLSGIYERRRNGFQSKRRSA